MKVVINKLSKIGNKRPTKFPWIGKLKDREDIGIVLFSGPRRGVVLYNSGIKSWGSNASSDKWNINYFEPFKGTLEISNDNP